MVQETDVLVVGGGATGMGVARDLAMRGVDVTLVERGPLAGGTTGRSHGLLHSGARYVVEDPASARECVAENRVLRDVAPRCVEPTGGYFVQLSDDSDDYFERTVAACRDCGIPVDVVSGETARADVPDLSPDVERAIRVPDAVVDPVRLVVATAADARERGARIRTRTAVTDLRREDGRVAGVRLRTPDGTEKLRAAHVVNAAGAWAGRVAALADADVSMAPTRGAMAVLDRDLPAVVNRCRPPDDGDIVVPYGDEAVVGTTSVPVDDPDAPGSEPWEVDLLREQGAAMVPALADAARVGTYSGVRPLHDPGGADGRDAGRDFHLLDHETRDGVTGLSTIVGGKLTTHRLMAERTADRVCDRLGVDAVCETAAVSLFSDGATSLEEYRREFDAPEFPARD